ncbi:MAG: RhuM family protein [Fibrobacter sp.]|nr:RhuM family protein [Fibrobacter sp.]MDD5943868.1 RhuM family protein [Fibrobacter sp.]
MGLTTFSGDKPTLQEALIAKNYLDERELRTMGQIVSGYLDFAERKAERHEPKTMADCWILLRRSRKRLRKICKRDKIPPVIFRYQQ